MRSRLGLKRTPHCPEQKVTQIGRTGVFSLEPDTSSELTLKKEPDTSSELTL